MKNFAPKFISIIIICLLFAQCASKKINHDDELNTALADMIRLIENKEHEKFLSIYMNPYIYKMMKKQGDIDNLNKDFEQNRAQILLYHLKKATNLKPFIKKETSTARYDCEDFIKPLVLKRIKGRWVLHN